MYTLKDVSAQKFTLLNEAQLVNIEGIKSVTSIIKAGQKKKVKAHLGLTGYLFSGTLKNAVRMKVAADLGDSFDFSFGI